MTRRLFYVALGATVGILVVRRASKAAARFTPAGVQGGIAGAISGVGDAIRGFGTDVREAMAEREQELRASLGLDGVHDLVDQVPVYPEG